MFHIVIYVESQTEATVQSEISPHLTADEFADGTYLSEDLKMAVRKCCVEPHNDKWGLDSVFIHDIVVACLKV